MTRLSELLAGLPLIAIVALGLLLLIQLVLQVYSLVDLARRPAVPGGQKWIWAVVIVLGNLLGAVIYLAVGRSASPPAGGVTGSASSAARDRALDRLYGGRDRR